MRTKKNRVAIFVLGAMTAAVVGGCGGGSSTPPPSISNINNSTTPTSPAGVAIAINGSNFQNAPGQVIFTQGSITASVTPGAGGWSNTSIAVVVPSGSGSTI